MAYRVLFVDDEPAVLRAISRNLYSEVDVTMATSPATAIDLLGKPGGFDAVVTDINMPGMDGLDFIEMASPLAPETRFIVLSGNNEEPVLSRANSMPAVSQVLSKPTGVQTIVAAIEAAIGSTPSETV